MPNKIITHPPSPEYDKGWDLIFKKLPESAPEGTPTTPTVPQRQELPPGAEVLPGGGIRMPRNKT